MPTLILTPLKNALTSLECALVMQNEGDDVRRAIQRDALIQRFEYTYELSWKMIKRTLEMNGGRAEVDELFSKQDLFRRAHEAGLIDDPEAWFAYHRARNQTSHAYNAEKAEEIAAVIPAFAKDARRLLATLEAKYAA